VQEGRRSENKRLKWNTVYRTWESVLSTGKRSRAGTSGEEESDEKRKGKERRRAAETNRNKSSNEGGTPEGVTPEEGDSGIA